MLLEMALDLPDEAMEDIRLWRPRTYLQHIAAMASADVCLRDYERIDPDRRALLLETAANANRLGSAIVAVLDDPATGRRRAEEILRLGGGVMHVHIRRLAAILGGRPLAPVDRPRLDAQDEIDALLAQAG